MNIDVMYLYPKIFFVVVVFLINWPCIVMKLVCLFVLTFTFCLSFTLLHLAAAQIVMGVISFCGHIDLVLLPKNLFSHCQLIQFSLHFHINLTH